MKILVVTNLFPNRLQPTRGMYNLQEFTELARLCELKVIAPIPWTIPFGKNGFLASIPKKEFIEADGGMIEVFHPRHLVIPKFGRSLYGLLLAVPLFFLARRLRQQEDFDALLAAWADPDGVATALVSRLIKKPFVLKVLGSDINELLGSRLRRRAIHYALKKASKVIAVSNPLKWRVAELGIREANIEVHPNGVNRRKFRPLDKIAVRRKLGLPVDRRVILFVGNLVPVKGVNYLLEAFHRLILSAEGQIPLLLIIGEGAQKATLQSMAQDYHILEHISFVGAKPHDEMPLWMNAGDILCLPSLNEGMPNVILEALACGKPVVASAVGGIPEMLQQGKNGFQPKYPVGAGESSRENDLLDRESRLKTKNGFLVPPSDPIELSRALQAALNANWQSAKISKAVEYLSWQENARAIMRIFAEMQNSKHHVV